MTTCAACGESRKIKVAVRPGKDGAPPVWSYHCYKCGHDWREGNKDAGTRT